MGPDRLPRWERSSKEAPEAHTRCQGVQSSGSRAQRQGWVITWLGIVASYWHRAAEAHRPRVPAQHAASKLLHASTRRVCCNTAGPDMQWSGITSSPGPCTALPLHCCMHVRLKPLISLHIKRISPKRRQRIATTRAQAIEHGMAGQHHKDPPVVCPGMPPPGR